MASKRQTYQGGDLVNWYKSKVVKIEEATEESVKEAGQFGEDRLHEYIETRGTGYTWKYPRDGRTGSFPGRVATGKMLRAAKYRINKVRSGLQIRLGWVTGTREEYFKYQEGGFRHQSGIEVKGMYAVQDAADDMFRELPRILKKNIRGK